MLHLLLAYLVFLPVYQVLLVVDDLLTPCHSLTQCLILQRLLPSHAFVEIDVGTVKVHAHLHSRCLHFGPFCDGFIDLSPGLQLLYIFLVVLNLTRKCSIFRLTHRYLLF